MTDDTARLVRDLNETELLELIVPVLPVAPNTTVDNGDDCAVYQMRGETAVSTDMLMQDRHFRLDWSTGADVGYRAAQQNIADALAMGALPVSLVVGLALPADTEVSWVVDFSRGLAEACAPWNIGVDGGDLVSGDAICIGVTVIGDMAGRAPITRSGAQVGDKIVHVGNIGHGLAGYELLMAGYTRENPGGNPQVATLIDDFLRPKPPVGTMLDTFADVPWTSLMDVSDGLIKDLSRIARASKVSCALHQQALSEQQAALAPIAQLVDSDPWYWILASGEDHGFIGTVPATASLPAGFTMIGEVTAGDAGQIMVDGQVVDADHLGWDHFRS